MRLGRDERPAGQKCWEKDTSPQCLRVELSDGSRYIFPYGRLHFVRFESGAPQDQLRLLMDTHEICITGKNLRELGLALQDLSVRWVRETPARLVAIADGDGASITRIAVTEIGEV